MVIPHHTLSPSILGVEKLLQSPPHASCARAGGRAATAPLLPHMLCHRWGGQHSCWVADTGVGKVTSPFPLLMLFRVWGGSVCWIGGGINVSVWPYSPLCQSGQNGLVLLLLSSSGTARGGAFSLPFLTPLISVSKPAFWNSGGKTFPSLPGTDMFCLLDCSACLSALQHQQICLTGTFRHPFAPR